MKLFGGADLRVSDKRNEKSSQPSESPLMICDLIKLDGWGRCIGARCTAGTLI